ncbi:MAG: GNAT family N-acetyltransferase [Pirellulaceae bacterium]
MSFQLFADPFTEADQSEMAGLHCGDKPSARAATAWITGSDVLDSIANYETRVWVFRNQADEIVGFGSLGPTRWRWPPPDGDYTRLLMIPQLGIDARFHGQPPDAEWRYSNQIMAHLILEAQEFAKEIQRTKPKKKHVELLILQVHKDNVAARRLYERFGFVVMPGFESNNHLVMSHKLAIPNSAD